MSARVPVHYQLTWVAAIVLPMTHFVPPVTMACLTPGQTPGQPYPMVAEQLQWVFVVEPSG
jgi:hypothetical protein